MHHPCNRLFLVIIGANVSAGSKQRRGAEPMRTSIQFAKRWILRVCPLFHPFLRPCVSDCCHKSKHIHFLLPPMHTSSLVVPFIFSLHSSLVTRPTNLLVFIAFVLYYSSIYQSRPFGSLRSLLFLLFLRGLISSAQSTFFLVDTSCTLFHIPTCHCCSKPRILHPQSNCSLQYHL